MRDIIFADFQNVLDNLLQFNARVIDKYKFISKGFEKTK